MSCDQCCGVTGLWDLSREWFAEVGQGSGPAGLSVVLGRSPSTLLSLWSSCWVVAQVGHTIGPCPLGVQQ